LKLAPQKNIWPSPATLRQPPSIVARRCRPPVFFGWQREACGLEMSP